LESFFDAEVATQAYIEGLGPEALAQAAAYTSGSHWLLLGELLVSVFLTLVIVRTKVLQKLTGGVATHRLWLHAFLVAAAFSLVYSLLSLPWEYLADFLRETR